MRRTHAIAIGSGLAALVAAWDARAENAPIVRAPTYATALFFDVSTAFIPVANDVPIMLSGGVRFARVHEIWARGGFMLTGDDVRLGFGAVGYRAALRPGKVVRPIFGGLAAGLPETCGHDAQHAPSCTRTAIFIFAATAGVRFEPTPWLGLFTDIAFGIDTSPNPFGMIEGGVSFAIPLS